MKIFSSLFRSRDKPKNSTAGSAYRFFTGGSTAGKNVTERSAMQMTAVYSCVRVLSEAVAGLPLHLYKYRSDGGKEKALNHPLYFLLHDEPNPEMTSFVFRETLMTHLLLWGNAYAQIIRNGKGEVIALYPLMPNRMTVDRDENGRLYYKYYRGNDEATNAVDTILNPPDYIEIGMDSDNDRSFNMLRDFVGNLADTAFRGVIVCRDKIPEDGNNMMLPWTNEEVGHAGIANTNTDTSIGTYNSNESGRIENGKGYRHVWDFASDKANGEIGCICLTTKDGGTNGMHHSYWNLSCGGTDLNSSSVDSFRQAYHTIVGHYILDSQFNCALYKWFYMDRLDNGNVRLLGKHIHNGCVYEVILFDPMSISVSNEKPFCGIISVKKVIELFPAAERIPDSMYDNSYHHGSYYYDCNTTSSDYVPQEEKEKLRQNWEDNPQWLAYFPYVIGDKIHIVATSLHHIHHYIYSLSDYSQVSKKTIETDTHLQNYGVGLNYVRVNNSSSSYRWFYGTGVNGDYCNALSAFEWDDKYFVITKNPLINGSEATSTNNFGQLRVFTKDGKSTGKIWQYVADGTLTNMTAASFWGFYVDEKTNTPLVICDSCNIPYSMLALEIIKSGDNYGRYRMRFSAPTYGSNYLYSYANIIKTDGLTLPLYILPFYPYSSSNQHYLGFALGICKLCLTTINNLSEPVRKLDGQVMKITYDIVDE